MKEFSPRLAGRRLRAAARLLRMPGVGTRLSLLALERAGIRLVRDEPREDGPLRPAIHFSAEARSPFGIDDE